MLVGRLLTIAAIVVGALVVPVTASSADVDGPTTTYWGVEGLATDSQTDSIGAEVFAIEQVGNRIYVGGRFTDVAHESRRYPQSFLAAFDAGSGKWIDSFTPNLDGPVYALEASPDGSRLFVGGEFEQVNGASRAGLVALDPLTGTVDNTWSGVVTGAPLVRALDVSDGWLYVAGSFNGVASGIGDNQAFRAARFSLATSQHDPAWRPQVQGGAVWGIAASPNTDRVYLAGYFTSINQESVSGGFAALGSASDTLVPNVESLQPNTANVSRQYSYDVEASNGLVWVAGSEHSIQVLNESDLSLKLFHRSSVQGDYQDLEVIGDRVYAGCHCRADSLIESAHGVLWFGTPPAGKSDAPVVHAATNTWVAAFDATTGQHIPSFLPPVSGNGAGIWAIHGSDGGACVWLGGRITNVSSSPVHSLTRLCDDELIDLDRPTTPGRPRAIAEGPDWVEFEWRASTDDVHVAGYELYDAASGEAVALVDAPTATLGGLGAGTHEFYVRAFDTAGNLSWRSGTALVTIEDPADTERPSVPGRPAVESQNGNIVELKWRASDDNVGVVSYEIYDATDHTMVATFASTSGTVEGLAVGEYSLYVKATDAAGNTSWRSGTRTVEVAGEADTQRPSVPKGLNANVNGSGIALTWSESTDNVGVTGYRVVDAATGSVVATFAATSGTIDGLAAGEHSLYVKATDAAGNMSWRSNIVSAVVS